MAGDWIKWEHGLIDKPEVIRISAALKLAREIVVCRLMKFWEWCDANIPDNAIQETGSAFVSLSPRDGDNVAFIDALVGTPNFADSLTAVDWIRFRDGRIELPNFGRHNGETAKTRARNAKNQKKKRLKPEVETPPKTKPQKTTSHRDVTGMSPPDGDKKVTREEERREEIREEKIHSAPPERDGPLPPENRGKGGKPIPSARARDPLFDAIAEVTGLDPKESGPDIGRVRADLAGRDPPFTPEDVREFARNFWKHCPYAIQTNRQRPTVNEVKKYINLIRAAPPPPQQPPASLNGRTKGEAMDNYAAKLLSGINERQAERVNFSGLPPAEDHG